MEIKTKYDVGDNLWYIRLWDGIFEIEKGVIKRISVGGKVWERYEIDNTTRAEKDLYEDFTEAKKVALEKQKEQNEKAIQIVKDYKEPMRF